MQRRHPSGTCTCWSWLPRAAAVRPPQDRRLVRVSPRRGPSCVPAVPVRATDALGLSPTDLHAAGDAPLPASVAVHARARDVGALCGRAMRQRQPAHHASAEPVLWSRCCACGDRLVAAVYRRSACRCRLPTRRRVPPTPPMGAVSYGTVLAVAGFLHAPTVPIICPCFLIEYGTYFR